MVVVGVLALQGDFSKHIDMLRSLGAIAKEVRKASDLESCDGLIIPGGESTVMLRQIDFIHMRHALMIFSKPIFGTCAGLILMSKQIQNSPLQSLGLIDVAVERNAFGRQVESFEAGVEVMLKPNQEKRIPAFFIRAPRIREVGSDVQVLGRFKDEPVLVKQGKYLGATFHPELTGDPAVHLYFLNMLETEKT